MDRAKARLSKLFLGSRDAGERLSLFEYELFRYPFWLIIDFIRQFSSSNLGISHHSLKCFWYYRELTKVVSTSFENVLEIGAGAFNFGHVHFLKNAGPVTYVVVDLAEVGLYTAKSLKTRGFDKRGNYRVFESSELNDFLRSPDVRKVIFATSDQLTTIGDSGIKFDLFVNHESFAEMLLSTVNAYLRTCGRLMKENSIYFLVNRESRVQLPPGKGEEDGVQHPVTAFDAYDLNGVNCLHSAEDEFRARLGPHKTEPNRLFVGQKQGA